MQFLAALVLPTVVCLLLTAVTAALWWKSMAAPWQYVALAALVCLGLHRVLQVTAELIKKTAFVGGYFVARRDKPDFAQLVEEAFTIEAILVSILLVAIAAPTLVWLKNARPHA